MKSAFSRFEAELQAIREAGTYKEERLITTPQSARIDTTKVNGVLNMCANNYLGKYFSQTLQYCFFQKDLLMLV